MFENHFPMFIFDFVDNLFPLTIHLHFYPLKHFPNEILPSKASIFKPIHISDEELEFLKPYAQGLHILLQATNIFNFFLFPNRVHFLKFPRTK